jgi:hypothetical protein
MSDDEDDDNHTWGYWYISDGKWIDVEEGLEFWCGTWQDMRNEIGVLEPPELFEIKNKLANLVIYRLKPRIFWKKDEEEWIRYVQLRDEAKVARKAKAADAEEKSRLQEQMWDSWAAGTDLNWRWYFEDIHPSAYLVRIDYHAETHMLFCPDYRTMIEVVAMHKMLKE